MIDLPPIIDDRPGMKPVSILVVDDDPSVVNLLKEFLSEEGYSVVCGYDGQMAIQLATEHRPNLIIMDVNMPVTNGLVAFQRIRKLADNMTTPVIFVSGELSKDVYPIIESSSRVAHLKKPMDLEDLHSMIRHFLQIFPLVIR